MTTDDLLDYASVATLAGVTTSTLRAYRRRGQMPEPDFMAAPDRPRWRRDTIRGWLAGRPGHKEESA